MGLRHRGLEGPKFQMREKLLAIGDDYWIEDDQGERVYKVDGKALRMRSTMDLEDLDGNRLCRIQSRVLHIRDTMAIDRPDVIGVLARSFNEMVNRVRRQQEDLEAANEKLAEANRDLEERVQQRTAQLEMANIRLSSERSGERRTWSNGRSSGWKWM